MQNPDTKNPRVQKTIHIPQDLVDEVEAIGGADDRKFSPMAVVLIREAIEARCISKIRRPENE